MTLLELLQNEQKLLNSLIESEGEILPEFEQTLKENASLLQSKIDGYDLVLQRLDAEAEIFKQREKEAGEIRKRIEKCAERLRNSLKEAMHFHKLFELKGNYARFTLSPAKPKIEVVNEDQLNLEEIYLREFPWVRAKFELNKTALFEGFAKLPKEFQPHFKIIETASLRRYPVGGKNERSKNARLSDGSAISGNKNI